MSLLEVQNWLTGFIETKTPVLKAALQETDSNTMAVVLSGVIVLVLLLLAALLVRALINSSSGPKAASESDESGHLDVLLHDLNTRLLNFMTQSREDMSFLKQEVSVTRSEVSEVKAICGRLSGLSGMDETASEISSRLSDFVRLYRDENLLHSNELKEMKALMLRILMLEADRGADKRRPQNAVIKDLKAL